LGHDPAMHFLFCQEAVPVVALVLTRVAVETGEWLGPAQHPLEDRPAPEHAAGCLVLRKHRVLDAETAEAVGELQPARPTADDDVRARSAEPLTENLLAVGEPLLRKHVDDVLALRSRQVREEGESGDRVRELTYRHVMPLRPSRRLRSSTASVRRARTT